MRSTPVPVIGTSIERGLRLRTAPSRQLLHWRFVWTGASLRGTPHSAGRVRSPGSLVPGLPSASQMRAFRAELRPHATRTDIPQALFARKKLLPHGFKVTGTTPPALYVADSARGVCLRGCSLLGLTTTITPSAIARSAAEPAVSMCPRSRAFAPRSCSTVTSVLHYS
jgi:hypothetical protein